MTTPSAPLQPRMVWYMYRAFVGIGVICTFIIAAVFLYTQPIIRDKQEAALQQSVLSVLGGAENKRDLVWRDGSLVLTTEGLATDGMDEKSARVYAGYDRQDRAVGYAITANGMGYQDNISVLYGYDPKADVIIGFHVLSSRETPGLGSKIGTDRKFLANFLKLDVSLNAQGQGLAHAITLSKVGQPKNSWQIDGITGATVSSKAVAKILRDSISRWAPRLKLVKTTTGGDIQ